MFEWPSWRCITLIGVGVPSVSAADSNVTAGYYLPRSLNSKKARDRIETIFDSVRSGESDHFFYLPNFCVAEVFSVFMKHTFGTWNSHVKKKGTIDTRAYRSLVKQFETDIHNGAPGPVDERRGPSFR